AEARWRPIPALLLVPGVRYNYQLFAHDVSPKWSFDPRLLARFTLDDATVLKGSLGLYHQSPVDAWRVPTLQPEQAIHATVGVERKIIEALNVSAELF